MPDGTPVRDQGAGQEVDERRLARAIGADQAETIATQDAGRKILDDHALAKRLRYLLGFDNELAGHIRVACFDPQSGGGDPLAPRGAHRRKAFETFLVALAPRGDTIA